MVRSILLAALAGCALPDDGKGPRAADDTGTGDSAPCDVAVWLPDADGDGHGDSAGPEVYACEAPAGHVMEGGDCDDADPTRALDCTPPWEDPSTAAAAHLDCPVTNSECGELAAVGDADADGVPDVALTPSSAGDVVLSPLPASDTLDAHAAALANFHQVGSVVGFGALDGAPGDDLVLATAVGWGGDWPYADVLTVRAWLGADLRTPAASFETLHGATRGSACGARLVGDLDADGRDDVLVWGPEDDGSGTLWWPPLGDGGDTSAADLAPLLEDVGAGVHGPGDLDGDGFDDLVVSVVDGRALVFDGPIPASLTTADARVAITGFGNDEHDAWVEGGDVDGDGRADLVARDLAYVYVVAGPAADGELGDLAVARLGSGTTGEEQITAASAAGDADGDGRADVLFGAYGSAASGLYAAGAVGLVHGPLAGTYGYEEVDARWAAGTASYQLGRAVAFAPDVVGDGGDDLLVAGYDQDQRGYWRYVTHVIAGR